MSVTSLRSNLRYKEMLFLGVLTLLCVMFSVYRLMHTDSKVFFFLNWNLFLAFVPWGFTSLVYLKPKWQKNKFVLLILLGSWLLFFPNAPYILTDLFHLRARSSMPIWFDLILILSFAWTGLLFGLFSLFDIEYLMGMHFKKTYVTLTSITLMFIGSFGIYLGRYLRWNSWDIISEPFKLFYDIGDRIVNPFEHPRTWGMTLCMGIFLNMIYISFKYIRKRGETHP